MTLSEALITAARRYCQDNHGYWADRYSKERTGNDFPYTYTDSDYNLFPRYNVLSAILHKVETLVGNKGTEINTCKQILKEIGLTAESLFTTDESNTIATKAMQDERDKFVEYILKLNTDDLSFVKPLPYRRRLSEQESKEVRKLLLETWNFQGNYWEPLETLSPMPTVFLMKSNLTDFYYNQIIEEIREHADDNIFEITEDGADAEIEFDLFHPDCYETIYCDKSFAWIVYGSHEGTVAFGGSWLTRCIRQIYVEHPELLDKWDQQY